MQNSHRDKWIKTLWQRGQWKANVNLSLEKITWHTKPMPNSRSWEISRQPLEGKIRHSLIYLHFSPNLSFFTHLLKLHVCMQNKPIKFLGRPFQPFTQGERSLILVGGGGGPKAMWKKLPSEQLNQKDISIQYTPKKKKDCQRMKMKTHFHHEC